MKVYLAAAFDRQKEIEEVAVRLRSKGIEVTSRWLYIKKERLENAFIDAEDVRRADMLVRFTDNNPPIVMAGGGEWVPRSLISGGRHFETGLAWERGIPIIVVGGKQNIFDEFPNIRHVQNVNELEEILGVA
jgi:hypothetical protein